MQAILLCVVAFGSTYWATRRSLWQGILTLLAWGFSYGILRANLLSTYTHFLFDAAIGGLYLAQLRTPLNASERKRTRGLRCWLGRLIGWPMVVALFPFQPLLVSLVGLRGSTFFLPVALLAGRLRGAGLALLSLGLAGLNLAVLGIATAEYAYGIEPFYPLSPVTYLIYGSKDVAGHTAHRIPGTFVNAHAYAGTMVTTLPILFGAWALEKERLRRVLLLLGIAAAGLGVLMAATRLHFVVMVVVVTFAVFKGRVRTGQRLVLLLAIAALTMVALQNERFQRFKSLGDVERVENRIAGGVNRHFFEILSEYPMGNGLGGGGTSIPHFLQDSVNDPIGMENEYARILAEQGTPGLLIWLCFIAWFASRPSAFLKVPWQDGRRLAWLECCCYFATGVLGTGLLTSIPQTVLMMLNLGWAATAPPEEAPERTLQVSSRPIGFQAREAAYAK